MRCAELYGDRSSHGMSSASCLTVVSNFPAATFDLVGFCAVLDRTRWRVSRFRHGDDQIPSGGSCRVVPQSTVSLTYVSRAACDTGRGRSVAPIGMPMP